MRRRDCPVCTLAHQTCRMKCPPVTPGPRPGPVFRTPPHGSAHAVDLNNPASLLRPATAQRIPEAAGKLQRTGLIHYSRSHITILDRPGPGAQACGCIAVVKQAMTRLLPKAPRAGPQRQPRPAWPRSSSKSAKNPVWARKKQ